MSELEDCCGTVVSCCHEKLVVEARDSLRTQQEERPYSKAATEQRLVNSRLYVTVICKV
jgi:hypothetical protein